MKVLVVEDEMIVARDIENRLNNLGYTVVGLASTGEEAVRTAIGAIPDLVLMDIMLKGEMDGIQAAERINRELDIPVVYLTAYADETTLERAKITGPFGYIVKPFEQRGLHTTIETALYKHELEKKLKVSEQRYRTLQENLPIGIFRATPDGRLISVNPAMVQMFGRTSADELMGMRVNDLYASQAHRLELRKGLRISGVVTNFEAELLRNGGERFWASLNVRAVQDDTGRILYHDGTMRDVTAIKRAEEREKEYLRDLAFLSKTAMEFVAQTPGENLYDYVAEKVREIVPGSLVVAVTSLDLKDGVFTLHAVAGLGKRLGGILKVLGQDPIGWEIPFTDEIGDVMKKGRLRHISAEYDRHSGGAISKSTAGALRKLMGAGQTYLMGLLKQNTLLGSVVILMKKGQRITNRDMVEAFINQAAVAFMRQRAEQAQHESEKRYRQLFHYMSIGISILEAVEGGKDFIFKDFNRAAEKINRLETERVIGARITEVFPGLKDTGILDVIKKVWRKGGSEYLPAWLYKDERISGWRESYIYKLPSGEIVNAYQDVTDKILAEEALKNSEERHRSVVENARDAIVTIDDEGLISFWNRAAEMMFGYTEDEIVGRSLTQIIPNRFQNGFKEGIQGLKTTKATLLSGQHRPVSAMHKDGHEFSVEISVKGWKQGSRQFYTSIIRDVTERIRMEVAILTAKQEWERTFDTVPDMIAILDTTGRVIRANLSLAARLSINVKELIGKHFYDVLYGTPEPPVEYMLPETWGSGESFSRELHLAHLDGDFSLTLTPRYDPSNQLVGAVFVGRDITVHRRADEALRRQAMINQAEHIFSSIRHEMGNALNTLKTTLSVLWKNYLNFDPEKRETYFIRCLDTFKVAERLLGVLKEYQKFDKLELNPIYLDRFLQEKSGLFVDLARHSDVDCEVDMSFSDVRINVDRDALIQVLLNVVDNAIAATRNAKNPLVSIGCRPLYMRPKGNDWAVITVADNGRGIPEDELTKVFTPLFTTKPEGSGLGMAIVQKRMMQMGGEAKIQSKPNQGTTVELWLPLYSGEKATKLPV
ncbi:MAG TPA: PAS domain S-box protein [bacterium]|nr:PAS domain S-box protein [bacterium]